MYCKIIFDVMYFIGLNAEHFFFTVPRYSNIDIPVKMSDNSVKTVLLF